MTDIYSGHLRYYIVTDNQILLKIFEGDELQNICASLIEGYEKDGDSIDLWNEIFKAPKDFKLVDSKLQITLEIGVFEVVVESQNTIKALLKHLIELDKSNDFYMNKTQQYEGVLKEMGALNKKAKFEKEIKEDKASILRLLDSIFT